MTFEKRIALPAKVRDVIVGGPTTTPAPVPPPAMIAAASEAAERERIERILGSLRDAVSNLRHRESEYLHAMQKLTMELSVAIASKLLHEQIETGDFPIERLVRQVTERLESRQAIAVHLHPADLTLLKKRTGGELFPSNVEIEFVADPSLARGDCKASAGDVTVLANLEDQLADIRRRLLRSVPEPKRQSA